MPREKLEEVYAKYRQQIDDIANRPGMKFRKLARITAYFYGGSEESWRKILATRTRKRSMPKEVQELLEGFGRTKH
jgi:hypothetical protein